jgi:pimeloyl-ACP methyl ester carboxylesterase
LLVGGAVLRQLELGAGEPVVVLEAGRNDVADSWRPVMSLLAPHVRVVAYDRAGLGGSDPRVGPVTIDRQVSDLASVIDGLAADRYVLVGHSWGGILVQVLAFRRPDLVAGLVLVDPAHEDMGAALPRAVRWGMRLALEGRHDELRGADNSAVAIAAALREVRSAAQPFADMPVVVLSAGRRFPRRFRQHWTALQEGLAAAAPHGRHIIVEGSGHNLHRDAPGVVADAILQVVDQARGQ